MAVDSIGDSQTAELAAQGLHSKLGQEIEDVNLGGWPQISPWFENPLGGQDTGTLDRQRGQGPNWRDQLEKARQKFRRDVERKCGAK